MNAAAFRGRKPAPANRSRQQLQRERALQLAVQKNHSVSSHGLSPEQELNKTPAREPDGPPLTAQTATPVVSQEVQQKPTQVTENHQASAEEMTPAVKELETIEVELLVCFNTIFIPEITLIVQNFFFVHCKRYYLLFRPKTPLFFRYCSIKAQVQSDWTLYRFISGSEMLESVCSCAVFVS